MEFFIKNRQILIFLLLISLASFLVSPKIVLADDFENITSEELSKYLELPEKDTNKLRDTLKQVFTTEGILAWSSGDVSDEETAVAITLLKVVGIQALSHLLIDAPLEITQKIIKAAINIVQIYINPAVFWEKFEKFTVEQAIEEGKKQLFQNEIRVTPGAIKFKYDSYKGGEKEIVLQYVMIYKPEKNEKRAEVVIRFYMPNSIEAPVAPKYGSITSLYVPDLKKDLLPFIVEIKGIVEKDEFGNYRWINEIGEISHPSVNITFPDNVPDLGIKPSSLGEKYLLKPIETTINEIDIIITKVTGKSLNLVGIWDKIKSFFSKINPPAPAALIKTPLPEEEESSVEVGQEIGQEVPAGEKVETLETKPQIEPKSEPRPLSDSEKIQEDLDDIAEKIDIISQEVGKLVKLAKEKGIKEEEEKDEEIEELEEEKEDTENKEGGICIANINTASKEELQKITGIGPVMAQRIIEARPFYSLSDLIRVSGIGEVTLQKIIAQGCAYVDDFYSSYASAPSSSSPSSKPTIHLSYPAENLVNKEIEVTLSASNLKNTTYDVKISIESGTTTLSDIYNQRINDWQSSYKYVTSTFSGTSFLGNFKLKIKEEKNSFRGEADILARVRESGESSYLEFNGKINITDPKQATSTPAQEEEPQEEQLPLTVVINEIAWMGTTANLADEWLELYNNTTSTIDLTSWTLSWSHGTTTHSLTFSTSTGATTTISANGFFLLERSENNQTISDIFYDQFFTGGFNNNGERLELRNASDILIDLVDCSSGWFAGTTIQAYISMERIDSTTSGNVSTNWANNNLITRNGLDAGSPPNKINGTPRAENSVSKSETEIFAANQLPFDEFDELTLTYLGSPYTFKYYLQVPAGKTLNIEPGVILKFDSGWGVEVEGTLRAIGQESKKIIFTSFSPPNYWQGIHFSSSTNSELIWTEIKYGRWCPTCGEPPAILVENSSVNLKNSILEDFDLTGIRFVADVLGNSPNNDLSLIENSEFLSTNLPATAIHIQRGNPKIKNSFFKGNKNGILVETVTNIDPLSPDIEGNNFEENEKPIWVLNANPILKSNRAEKNNNTINGIVFHGHIYSNSPNFTWFKNDIPYVVKTWVQVDEGGTLTINPGVIVKFDSESYFAVEGNLLAEGTEEEPIVFTSLATPPAPGSWGGLTFRSQTATSTLKNVIVSYGGVWNSYWTEKGLVSVIESKIEADKLTVKYGLEAGLHLQNSDSIIQNSHFENNQIGVRIEGNIFPQITATDFINNQLCDIYWPNGGENCEAMATSSPSLTIECGCCPY